MRQAKKLTDTRSREDADKRGIRWDTIKTLFEIERYGSRWEKRNYTSGSDV